MNQRVADPHFELCFLLADCIEWVLLFLRMRSRD